MKVSVAIPAVLSLGCVLSRPSSDTAEEAPRLSSWRDGEALVREFWSALSRGILDGLDRYYLDSPTGNWTTAKIRYEIAQAKRKHYEAAKGGEAVCIRTVETPQLPENESGVLVLFKKNEQLYYLPVRTLKRSDGTVRIVDVDAVRLAPDRMMKE